mgnify:CR=1 FL=1|jgi:AbrB family looped-hinge helix DNA binding protein
MIYVSTVAISPKGQIVLPKKIRKLLDTNIVTLEIDNNKNIIISPIHDVGGALASYQVDNTLPFEQIREQAWNNSVSVLKDNEASK